MKKKIRNINLFNEKSLQCTTRHYELILSSFQPHFLAPNLRYYFDHILLLLCLIVLWWFQFKLSKFSTRHTLAKKKKKCIKICTLSFTTASACYFIVFVWGATLTVHLIWTYFELLILINCIKLNFYWNSNSKMSSPFQMLPFGNFLKFLLINFELKFTFQNHCSNTFWKMQK